MLAQAENRLSAHRRNRESLVDWHLQSLADKKEEEWPLIAKIAIVLIVVAVSPATRACFFS